MAVPKQKPVISKNLARAIQEHDTLKELFDYWEELSPYCERVYELKRLRIKHGFDTSTKILAYLWSTEDYEVETSYFVYIDGWVNGAYQKLYIKKQGQTELTNSKKNAKVFDEIVAIEKVEQLKQIGLKAFKEKVEEK